MDFVKNSYALTGIARSGKDTAGKMMAEKLGVKTYYLSKPIKDVICALFNWGEEHRDGSYKEIPMMQVITPDQLDNAGIIYKEYGLEYYEEFHDCWDKLIDLFDILIEEDGLGRCTISPRSAFQLFGTEWGRNICDTIWLDIAPKSNVVITDVRFDNEAQYFKELGFDVVLIERTGFKPVVTNNHASESGVNTEFIDHTIINDTIPQDKKASLKQLENKIYSLIRG